MSKETKVFAIRGLEMLPQADEKGNIAVIVASPSKNNPSKTGNHKINEGQLKRLSIRCLGFYSPNALKQLIALSNGSAQLSIDEELIKPGDTYVDKYGVTQTYKGSDKTEDGSWVKRSNHEVKLGVVAQMKLTEMTINHGLSEAQFAIPTAKVERVVEERSAEDAPKV